MAVLCEVILGSVEAGCVGVAVSGEVDMECAHRVFDGIVVASQSEGADEVRVDLSGVTFIDSSGLSALVRAGQDLDLRQRRLVLAAPSPPVSKVLMIAGMDSAFTIIPEADEWPAVVD